MSEAYKRRERARDGGDSRFRLAPSLVQEEADGQEDRRARERERDAGLDADPAAVDGDDEEQDDADDDREPAEPREDPSAEQILERSLWLLRLGRNRRGSPARSVAGGGGGCTTEAGEVGAIGASSSTLADSRSSAPSIAASRSSRDGSIELIVFAGRRA